MKESPRRLKPDNNNNNNNDNINNNKNNDNKHLLIIEENKSLSFADLRPIPKSWGLSKDNDILFMFEFPRRTSNETKVVEYEEENQFRLGGLVNNAIEAIKIASDSVSSPQDITTMCDKFIRCKDSNRQSTSSLLLAVDTILALISDGLSVESLRNKKLPSPTATGIKMTQRLWMFIEESCRGTLVKDPSLKLALGNLLKQVKQISGTTNSSSKSKEWAIQLKLQIFIVLAIRNNLLHVWLKAVVANDTILHRFFNSGSFLRQARTSYSNALSAVVVETRHLSMPGSSRIYNVSKPISLKSRGQHSGPSPNSSSENSLQKSKIPRSNRRPTNLIVK